MHPTILCGIKAAPMIEQILAAVKIERWRLQDHEGNCLTGSDEVELTSYYGRTDDGGGFAIVLVSGFVPSQDALDDNEDEVVLRFNFSRGGSIVSSVEFSYGLDSGSWFVVHESSNSFLLGEDDPAAGLAEQLGIELNNKGVDHVHEDEVFGKIALAADYAFANCDEPDASATA